MASEGDVHLGAGGAQGGSRQVDPVAGKTVAEILGEIVWLMTQDPAGREMKVAEIEALVMPAVLSKRFHIRYAQVADTWRSGSKTFQPVEVLILGGQSPETVKPTLLMKFSLSQSRLPMSHYSKE